MRGTTIHVQTAALAGTWGDAILVNSSKNVTLGTSDLASTNYNLYVTNASYFGGSINLANDYYINWKDAGGTARTMVYLNSSNNLHLGTGLKDVTSGSGILALNGQSVVVRTAASGGSYTYAVWVNSSQNVTLSFIISDRYVEYALRTSRTKLL